jgi:hypothetical protein
MAAKKARKARLQIGKSKKDGKFYWRFIQSNGRSTAIGGEGYNRRNDLLRTLVNMGKKLMAGQYEVLEDA